MTRILYLDFDGVLHDKQVYFHPRRGIYMNRPGRVLFEWMPILDRLLAPHPDVRIVLSTSWVSVRNFNFVKKHLSPSLQDRVVGATFHDHLIPKEALSRMPRGVQIAQDLYRRAPESWFAIDDDDLGWPARYRDNLIRTRGARGISEPAVQTAIKEILERSSEKSAINTCTCE
jgi:hypothetical protein